MTKITIPLAQAHKFDVVDVGGKALHLGILLSKHITVPNGFVIPSWVLSDIKKSYGLDKKIHDHLIKLKNSKMKNVEVISRSIRELIETADISNGIELAIHKARKKLGVDYVAVRSSAASEDQEGYSWAGEFETYTQVNTQDLLQRIKQCWSSLYTSRALMYAYEQNQAFADDMAVIVQEMVKSDISGVCFTKDPNDNDSNSLIIEAIWGLGELLVHGDVTPDKYWVDKKKVVITDVEVESQKEIVTTHEGKHQWKKVSKKEQKNQKLQGEEIITIAQVATTIEKIMKCPQDIEWSFSHKKLYILQSRPITATDSA